MPEGLGKEMGRIRVHVKILTVGKKKKDPRAVSDLANAEKLTTDLGRKTVSLRKAGEKSPKGNGKLAWRKHQTPNPKLYA